MTDIELYKKTAQPAINIEDYVEKYAYIVKRNAYHLLSRLPKSVQVEDLIQAGMIGLIEAAQRFDPSKQVTFETYANIRIRGTMLDDLRKSSWMPRSVHHNMRKIAEAIHKIENETGQEAQTKDIIKELGVDIDTYSEMAGAAQANELFSFEDLHEDNLNFEQDSADPYEETQKLEIHGHLKDILKTLPDREQAVLSFYYSDRLRFKEIGDVLGIGEARVCQIHGQALARLQSRLKKYVQQRE
ncbi:MAG: RNA polymerase sigma factor FliA [Legionellales bacterium]|nr:RNA polymerase sigma factor FliA [Legionellales bacterium]